MYLHIDIKISVDEVRRRVGEVLKRNHEYTGKIAASIKGNNKVYFWDSGDVRPSK